MTYIDLSKALAKAQSEMENAELNQTNPHFRSKFADLASVRKATLPALTKNGLAITQFTTYAAGEFVLITRLLHESGEYIDGEWPLPQGKPQEMGSALTYAKRYCWASICGIASEEDDDGEATREAGDASRKTKATNAGNGQARQPKTPATVAAGRDRTSEGESPEQLLKEELGATPSATVGGEGVQEGSPSPSPVLKAKKAHLISLVKKLNYDPFAWCAARSVDLDSAELEVIEKLIEEALKKEA